MALGEESNVLGSEGSDNSGPTKEPFNRGRIGSGRPTAPCADYAWGRDVSRQDWTLVSRL